ncbi:MAG: hypothetical protein K2P88_07890 [Chitinophagaceae bacterium]|uniref:hypothetical protein n=1 Tax=unclassified Paraflavitalea TaxID=2798305 RepID=UPI003D3280BA|nr:hypothetical protein [Chitinophagaceae bacterium]
MKLLYLINYSFCAKVAKKPKIPIEDIASSITSTECFFALIAIEIILISFLPFTINPYVGVGISGGIWYFTHYPIRYYIKKRIVQLDLKQVYSQLNSRVIALYVFLCPFINLVIFCLLIIVIIRKLL